MSTLYTKNGRPLQLSGDRLYSRSGTYLGHINDNKVFAPNGRYAATVVGDRVIYRSTDSARIGSPTAAVRHAGSAAASAARSALWGDEPSFPD